MPSGNRRRFFGAAGTAAGVVWTGRDAAAATQPPAALGVYDVTRFGAVADGRPSTDALQKAIDACGAAGGGTVLLPPGRYTSGALFLRSHVNVHLVAGAVLAASRRPAD